MQGQRVRGFTLIELLVVMAIVATLAMIAVPRYFSSLEQARETTLRQDLSIMREAIDKYFGDLGAYPETLADLVDKRYLRALPSDPLTKSTETWITVPNDNPELPGIKDVHSGAQGEDRNGRPFAEL
jgi:general secretion pathway protein G